MTTGGCCVQPYFSFDSEQVLFIDKPGPEQPVGIYGVDVVDPQPTPILVSEMIGYRSRDGKIIITIEGDLARFTNETTGQIWTVNTNGNRPHISPAEDKIVWVATDREGPYDRRQNDIWLADLDGDNAQKIITTYGGGFGGWFPDGERILLVGKETPAEEERTLFTYDINSGERVELFSHDRLRRVEISPGGSWIVFYISFAEEEPELNGIWLMSADGTQQHQADIPRFGPYQWRDDDSLVYIPLRSDPADSMQLWTIEAATGQSRPLTDPDSLSFVIANGDWQVSPDGNYVIFVNKADSNIWLITLP